MVAKKWIFIACALLSVALLLPSVVSAQPAKSGQPAGKSGVINPQILPGMQYDQMSKVETSMDQIRDNEIATVEKLLKLGPTEEEKPKLVFRLAELFTEKAKYFWFVGMAAQDEEYRYANEPEKLKAAKDKKDEAFKQSANYRRRAMEYYKVILERYPRYAKVDEVLFYYGFLLMEAQQQTEALKIYRKLITEFPNSSYVPDAYLAFGEYYFNKGELERALEAYKRVVKFEKSRVYGFALYKMGWIYYNLAEWEKALDMFAQVIKYSTTSTDENKENKITLKREATKDFVLAYSMLENIKNVKEVFLEVGGQENYPRMIDSVANLLFDQGKDKQALVVFEIIIKDNPNTPKAALFQAKRIESYNRLGDKRKTVEETRRLVEMFQAVEKELAEKPAAAGKDGKASDAKDKELRKTFKEAQRIAEQKIRELATLYHNEAKKTGAEQTFFVAHELYGDYLTLFPDSKDAYNIRFFYAELLYKLGKYERAGDEYSKVFLTDQKGKYAKDASHSAILAYKEVAKKEPPPKEKTNKEIPLPKIMQKRVEACERYVKAFPDAENTVDVKYEIGEIMYKYNHFKDANRMFADIALNHPESKLAEYSVNLILDSFNLAQNWAELNAWSRKFLENPKIAKGRVKEDLKRLVAESSFKMIEDYEKNQQWELAAQKYMEFVKEFPDSKMADLALYNAAANYDRLNDIGRTLDVKLMIVSRFPDSKYTPTVLWSVAEQYRNRADFLNAAKYYEIFADRYKKDKNAPLALFNAGVFRFGLEQYTESLDDRAKYLKEYGKEKDAPEVFLSTATIYEKQKNWNKAAEVYGEFQKKFPLDSKVIVATVNQGLMLLKDGEKDEKVRKEAMKLFDKVVTLHKEAVKKNVKIDPVTLEAVAHARFILVEDIYKAYESVKLELPEAVFQKRLADKQKAMEKVYAAYTEVVNYKVAEWAIASLYKIGLAYENFIKTLLDIPVPKELKTNDQKELYRQMIREQTMPIEDKVVSAYQAALAKSAEFGLYNDWSVAALERLTKMRPFEYSIGTEMRISPDYFGEDIESNGLAMGLDWEKMTAPKEPPKAPPPATVPAPQKEAEKAKEAPKPEQKAAVPEKKEEAKPAKAPAEEQKKAPDADEEDEE